MPPRRDLTGQVFGQLTVIRYSRSDKGGTRRSYWWCECSCGRVCVEVQLSAIVSGNTKRCAACRIDMGAGHKLALTEDQVREIRRLYSEKKTTYQELSDIFKVSPPVIAHALGKGTKRVRRYDAVK